MVIFKDLQRLFRIGRAFRKGEKLLTYFPTRMWIELTAYCNLACPCCLNRDLSEEEKGYMAEDLFQTILHQIRGRVHDLYLFHRGESLLHPRIIPMIFQARQEGLICRLHTNATLLTPVLARGILDSGLQTLSFSFDGYRAASYETQRYPAKFEATLEKIEQFLRLKKESGNRHPFTVLQMILDKPSLRDPELERFVSLLKKQGLDRVVFRRPHNWGGALKEGVAADRPSLTPLSCCTFPWYALVVYWNGKVGPCPQDFFARLVVGDFHHQPLEAIWNGTAMQGLREKLKNKDYAGLHPCGECDRPSRRSWAGVPTEYFRAFLQDNLQR